MLNKITKNYRKTEQYGGLHEWPEFLQAGWLHQAEIVQRDKPKDMALKKNFSVEKERPEKKN
ncbi:hypothetical protein [Chlorobium phaeobacteroides]|jgi:hypothetical protein|uniref:Uncharacterized protein n=1 Tax=Chlorobium phaeobacteroides (strain DSM 266 / SMG 266 / 2430) TaxID=290317 RepID=A1BDQ2_CHLPD|nr:hypothetical protein [Chlorobium phaeobacteroides]ABL64529.1 hypothetical protein Cpha266_0472 [Chlorobium phaeobacteroides DSM 266]MBV5326572.1 hypothetical protein [Chlorobium sp.]